MPPSDKNTNLIWVDLEMTGLDLEIHKILQIALIITNKDLEVLYIHPEIIIYQPPEILGLMDQFVSGIHQKSGLTSKCEKSVVSEIMAEKEILQAIRPYTDEKSSPLCGNTIWNDRRFIAKYMKSFEKYLHKRVIDVSSIKELYYRWKPNADKFVKGDIHNASTDVMESIEELKYYRKIGFIG